MLEIHGGNFHSSLNSCAETSIFTQTHVVKCHFSLPFCLCEVPRETWCTRKWKQVSSILAAWGHSHGGVRMPSFTVETEQPTVTHCLPFCVCIFAWMKCLIDSMPTWTPQATHCWKQNSFGWGSLLWFNLVCFPFSSQLVWFCTLFTVKFQNMPNKSKLNRNDWNAGDCKTGPFCIGSLAFVLFKSIQNGIGIVCMWQKIPYNLNAQTQCQFCLLYHVQKTLECAISSWKDCGCCCEKLHRRQIFMEFCNLNVTIWSEIHPVCVGNHKNQNNRALIFGIQSFNFSII